MSFVHHTVRCCIKNFKLFKSLKIFMIGSWTSKQEEENQGSSDGNETECDSMMLRTFHHIYLWVASSD